MTNVAFKVTVTDELLTPSPAAVELDTSVRLANTSINPSVGTVSQPEAMDAASIAIEYTPATVTVYDRVYLPPFATRSV
jgi:hypothetical protein